MAFLLESYSYCVQVIACLDKFLADRFISCILLNFDDANRIITHTEFLKLLVPALRKAGKLTDKVYKLYFYWKFNLITEIRF